MLFRISIKTLCLLTLVFFAFSANATNYYFSASGNDANSGTDPSTPWKTLNKLNSYFSSLNPGDNVLLNKGDVFYGSITINKSGTAGSPIRIGAFGIGADPVITGFTTVSAWTNLGSNIWESTNPVSTLATLNMVVINGVVAGMGRYPNTGYLHYQSHTANTSITSSDLTGTIDWTGAEVVIRKYRWILDRQGITSQSGGTLNYSATSPYGNNNAYSPVDGNGFFIQNDARTLDVQNEWYYNSATKKLQIYSTSSPTNVEVSTVDNNISFNTKAYITFTDINFEGGNTQGAYLIQGDYIVFANCNFSYQGGNAIFGENLNYFSMTGGSINNSLNAAINFDYVDNNCLIDGVDISTIGTIAGAMRSGDGVGEGIAISGNGTIVRNSRVVNTGYNAIAFNGNNALIEKNYIDTYCTVKDDGGGIYTYSSDSGIIRNNIVLNAIGAQAGTEAYSSYEAFGKACGIYLDNGSANHHAQVSGNNLAHGQWGGILINNNGGNIITDNTVYDFDFSLHFMESVAANIRTLYITRNKFIARTNTQVALYSQLYINESPGLFGTIDSNYYARPIADSFSIQSTINGSSLTPRTLAGWQTYSGIDAHSHKSSKTITDTADIRFEYNATSSDKTISLDANYIDVTGKSYLGTITLAPFSSAVLIRNGAITSQPPIANAGTDQTITLPTNYINLSGSATDPDGNILAYTWTEISGPAATIVSPNSQSSSVTGLLMGSYKFQLTVTDNKGAIGKDSLQITVIESVLPLTLLTFKGQPVNSKVSLTWETANEKNVSGFDIEKMAGNKWVKIGFIQSAGGSLAENDYFFSDYLPVTALNFYRLKIVDIDGKYVYSDIINVEVKPNKNVVYQNVPNAFSGITTIRYEVADKTLVKITVFNEAGSQIAVLTNGIRQPGSYQIQWNAETIPSGNYFYAVIIGDTVITKKMLKIN